MKMTIDQFERLVLKLANQTPTRYWKHWNYPDESRWLMAVTIPAKGAPTAELEGMGLARLMEFRDYGNATFFIERDREAESTGNVATET